MPPGAFDLPDVFSNAMKLFPTMGSPNKTSKQESPTSPGKPTMQRPDSIYDDSKLPQPSSPTRTSNKENTSPTRPSPQKENSFMSQAAASRQDPYRPQDSQRPASPTRQKVAPSPTQEEMEKLQKASVKRLANVTQLCTLGRPHSLIPACPNHFRRLPRLLLRPPQLRPHPANPHGDLQSTQSPAARHAC